VPAGAPFAQDQPDVEPFCENVAATGTVSVSVTPVAFAGSGFVASARFA